MHTYIIIYNYMYIQVHNHVIKPLFELLQVIQKGADIIFWIISCVLLNQYLDSLESKNTTQAIGPPVSGILPSTETCGQLKGRVSAPVQITTDIPCSQ